LNPALDRIILYVHDVPKLTEFYGDIFGFPIVEEIADEWTVFRIGSCELALHRVGVAYRAGGAGPPQANTNAKLVVSVDGDLATIRETLVARGVSMRDIKSFPGLTGPLCDGTDPEGNVFQLAQR
jgi:predicted enzyme related to lactoylglutathione lyase